ncbi:MAG: hypothetical protein FRX48_08527 [Lasallia pustulata]|uniref:Uncharacterized protein n=1 Tax=Lasallia pustulata TaxID=136370 RepID=A0A5M8PEB4_9LECA|nr:MAG: hypothetical protein FRX48_08527 [Lasallia pustulata]
MDASPRRQTLTSNAHPCSDPFQPCPGILLPGFSFKPDCRSEVLFALSTWKQKVIPTTSVAQVPKGIIAV